MQNHINVIAVSQESDHVDLSGLNILSGKYGGTCYAKDGYETIKHQPVSKAVNRAAGSAKRGHHSVFQHSVISFEIICSKMMCIVLNSIGVSNTSEKSARYTYMHPEEDAVDGIYRKWCGKFHDLIKDYMGKDFFTPSELEKMVLDQARYMLSVFTPTSMVYTIPYRNLCYLLEWMQNMADCLRSLTPTDFHVRLRDELISLKKAFRDILCGEPILTDNKAEFLRVLPFQTTSEERHICQEFFGDIYQFERKASFTAFAHLLRHRTTTNWINFNGEPGEYGFYTPPLLKLEKYSALRHEWENDIRSISDVCPQGTLVSFVQQGTFDKFILVCKERLCGRALLETQNICKDVLQEFRTGNLSNFNKKVLWDHLGQDDAPCARCRFKDFTCTDGCKFGPDGAFTRLI